MQTEKLLIVDDDKFVANIYRHKFALEGFTVQTASDGEDALMTAEVFKPDAVILDLDLPRLSGHDVYKEFAANAATAKIPIIVVTGTDVSTLSAARFACVLRKPISVEALIYTIENCLKKGDATRLL